MKAPRLVAAKLQQLVDRIDPQAGRYRMLFETSPLPMWVVDDETLGFLAVNDAAVRLYGYSREEFLAMTAERFLPHPRTGSVFRGVFRHPQRNGELLDVDAVGHLVGWRGRPARLVVINDISERLRAQAALERVNRELELSHERLRALSRRLLEIQEEERARLARDLHDDIGQALTALKIQVESLRASGEAAQRGRVPQRVEECVETIQSTLERVRQLSLSLRPPQLDDLGLAAALRSHLDRQARVAGLAPHFDADDAPHDIAPETETACFRVAQEAITNVLRHARARNLWLRLYDSGGRLALSVRDDGMGFDASTVRGLGLAGMEERTALAGGSLELRATPGSGTLVLATFPLEAGEAEALAP
ncbi:MAG TPA: sensor histidine kinase [Burkholderiales bacterium]|nr:sensor histidine kinase [Burkholderiales bacterium]